MRISGCLSTNIYVNNISKKVDSKNIENDEELSSSKKGVKKDYPNIDTVDDDILKYKTVYNKATLEKSDNDNSNEELSNMLDKKLYDSCHLSDLGIKYGSKEYEEWKERWKNNFVIPLDAPVGIRKKLFDMADSIKDEITKIGFADSLIDNLKGVDTSNPRSYFDLCDKVISQNNKFIGSMNSSGAVSDPYIKAAVDLKKNVNECFFKLKLDLEDMFENEK